ncbi:MAG: hypothetical protein ABS69_00920 [Nitrosomonadales bacterium SCN 54-20]|nr:MAG: hypothetical protein ABS69_00920 [Nitrosomonadales bacterium SCN 54-20]
MAAALETIQDVTGLPMEKYRLALPAANDTPPALNPTKLGELIGLSARAINFRLAALGLQRRNERDEWELTEEGLKWAEAIPYSRNGHAGYQILWNPVVSEQVLKAAA